MHVAPHEYFNAGLSEGERDQISLSFHERCCGDVDEMKGGVRRVDFLMGEVIFKGFAPTKMRDTKVPVYELKTSVVGDFPKVVNLDNALVLDDWRF
jgi:hypothetical protein